MASSSKSQRQRARRQRQAKRIRAKLNSKDGSPQVRQQANFYDLLGQAQQKALQPFIANQVKTLGQSVARNLMQLLAQYNLRLTVLDSLLAEKGLTNSADLQERFLTEEDKILNLVETNEAAKEGDYVRLTIQDIGNANTKSQTLTAEKLATAPYEVNETVEKEVIGMLKGQEKVVTATMPDGKEYQFNVTVNRISKATEPSA